MEPEMRENPLRSIFEQYIKEAEKYRHEFAMKRESDTAISEAMYFLILAMKTLGHDHFNQAEE